MKKILTLLLALTLVLALTACGGDGGSTTTEAIHNDDTTAAPVPADTTAPEDTTAAPDAQNEVFYFEYEGLKIVCGEAFDASALPEVEPYEIPSCAFEGTDMIYTYETFEVTAYQENGAGTVYSVYLLDPAAVTPEGLALGDDAARVTALYGEAAVSGDELTYRKGDTLLIILLQNDTVISIEYRLAV